MLVNTRSRGVFPTSRPVQAHIRLNSSMRSLTVLYERYAEIVWFYIFLIKAANPSKSSISSANDKQWFQAQRNNEDVDAIKPLFSVNVDHRVSRRTDLHCK